jgi:hypothetical protein
MTKLAKLFGIQFNLLLVESYRTDKRLNIIMTLSIIIQLTGFSQQL